MANPYFRFKQFTVYHHLSAMKVTTDACLFGAWVALQLQKDFETFDEVLDIGTGTGLLSLMVAQKNKCTIDAVEIDANAAVQARENFLQSPWAERLHVFEGDITTLGLQKEYDVIISNPPFYERELTSPSAARNVAHHSRQLNLQQLLHVIRQNLKWDGSFYLLLPYKRKQEVEALLTANGLHLHTMVIVQPSVSHALFRLLLKGGKKEKAQKEIETFSIRGADGTYTQSFTQLLQDYYLYL